MALFSREALFLGGLPCYPAPPWPARALLLRRTGLASPLHSSRAGGEAPPVRGAAGCGQRDHAKAAGAAMVAEGGETADGDDGGDGAWAWLHSPVQASAQAVSKVPGPRVGRTPLPWLLAIPLACIGAAVILSAFGSLRRYTSPKQRRRRQVSRNALLCTSLDAFLPSHRHRLDGSALRKLESQTRFTQKEILRKYIRYALNERPFNLDLVADLIHLRKTSQLEDAEVAEVLYDASHRIVKEKGPVVMDTRGFTEKGIKRKAAVQALFSKILYMAELNEFCPSWSSVKIKEIFGVTDEDADSMRIETLSDASDVESLVNMVNSDSEIEEQEDNIKTD